MANSSKAKQTMTGGGTPKPGTGTSTGGMPSNLDAGVEDAIERASSRGELDAPAQTTTERGLTAGSGVRGDVGADVASRAARAPDVSSGAGEEPADDPRDEPLVAPDGVEGGAAETDVERQTLGGHESEGAPPDGPLANPYDPDEPADEGPIESLGRSVSEAVIGANDSPRRGNGRP